MGPALRRRLVAAALVALAARAAAAFLAPAPVVKDAAENDALAWRLAAGDGYTLADGTPTAFRPPGLPLLLAVVHAAGGGEMAARLALALVGAAAVPLVGLLALALGAGERAAGWAAWAAALYPPFVTSWFSPRALLAEPLLTTLCAGALAAAVFARGAAGWALAAGALAAGAALTKGTLLFLAPLLAAYAWWTGGRSRARVSALVLAGAAAVLLPWTLRNRAVLGAWVPVSTNGGISVWASYNPASRGLGNASEGYADAVREDAELRARGMGEVERSRHFMDRARAEIAARPGRAVRLVLRKALLFWDPTLKDWSDADASPPPLAYNWAYAAVLPLGAAGAVLALALGGRAREDARRAALLLVAFVVLLSAVHVLLHTDVRYRVPLEPALLALAAVAAGAAAARWGVGKTALAAAAWGLTHALVAWRYPDVFRLLSRAVVALGLG